MLKSTAVNRRHLLRSAVALGAATGMARNGFTATPANGASALPARGAFVIRNAFVMTMDDAGDIANADVHVANGAIVAVGQNLKAPGVSAIDGRGMIVLPGLIETHWHMWNTLLRSMSGDKPDLGYFRTTAMLGQKYQAEDMYQGTRLACAEAINNGVTHVHDWCHNIRSPDYADADLKALRESGLRGRFSYGAAQGMPNNKGIDTADLTRLHDNWPKLSPDGLLTLGFAWRGQGGNNPATAIPPEISKAEIMISTRDINLGVFGDPAHMVVTAAEPSNVDTVVVDGRILKRNGKLTAMNTQQIVQDAAAANLALRKRADWW